MSKKTNHGFFNGVGNSFNKSIDYDNEKSRKFNDKKGDLIE